MSMNKKMNNAITVGFLSVAMLVAASVDGSAQQNRTPPQPAAAPSKPAVAENFASKGGDVVAKVGDIDLTADDVKSAISLLDARQQAAIARDPALLNQTVRALLANRLMLKEALAKKWDQQPAVVAQVARVKDSVITETYLESVSAPPENYPSDADIKSVYEANAAVLMVPRRFRLAQVLVTVAKDADKTAEDAARKKLDDIVKKTKQPGADFAAIAHSSSDDTTTAERDGEIGWVSEPDLRTEIRGQVMGLQKAAITDPIRLDDGWHILKLLDTEPARQRSLSEVRDALVQKMRAERMEANRRAYMADLMKQKSPVLNEIALSKLLEPKSETTPSR